MKPGTKNKNYLSLPSSDFIVLNSKVVLINQNKGMGGAQAVTLTTREFERVVKFYNTYKQLK